MGMPTTPVRSTDRIVFLDQLRGFALLGILLNNIYGFSGYGFLLEEQRARFSSFRLDRVLDFIQIVLVEGKFYSIFSLLFGIGFSIILMKGQQKGYNSLRIFYRRLLGLLLIGACHIYFLWEGDILVLYALIGMLLPFFIRVSNRALLSWSVLLLLSPILVDFLRWEFQLNLGNFLRQIADPIDTKNGFTETNWRTHLFLPENGWANWRTWQETAWAHRYYSLLNNNRFPKVMGMFLLGFYIGRNNIHLRLQELHPLLKKTMTWGFAVGLPSSLAMAYFEWDEYYIPVSIRGLADTVSYALAVVPLALAYTASLALLYLRDFSLLRFFAPVGKMALTTYLSQSIICVLLFYSAGLGLGQKFGLAGLFGIAFAIYLLQVWFSRWWLQRFEFGPVEWVWRQLTYGKRLAIKKDREAKVLPGN